MIDTRAHKHTTYTGIQVLRFVAAMLVVLAHSTAMVNERMHLDIIKWRTGWCGVDIFFVISGFVMAISSAPMIARADGWIIFLKRRIIRIVPLYWSATTLKLITLLAVPALAVDSPVYLWNTVASYLFIPTFNDKSLLDTPLLKVGWTLNYEMLFYALFTLALFFGRSPLKVTAVVFSLAVLANIFSSPSLPFVYGFLEPILLEFVMGMLVAKLCQSTWRGALNTFIGTLGGALVAAVILLASFTLMLSCGDQPIWWRWAYWGLPSMFIVAVVALCEPLLRSFMPKIAATLGDSSYSLYLFHTFTVPLLGSLLIKLKVLQPTLAVLACMIISPVVCLFIYKWFELPMTNLLKRAAFRSNNSAT